MNKFDTKVQFLKYEVLREVARHAWQDDLLSSMMDIPKEITQSDHPGSGYYTYKEMAILSERVKRAVPRLLCPPLSGGLSQGRHHPGRK